MLIFVCVLICTFTLCEKTTISMNDAVERIKKLLKEIHEDMFNK